MPSSDLLETLKINNSILLNQTASNWKEAVKISIQPLIDKKLATNKYYEAIITSVNQHGPYFIISENVAMPHAAPDKGALGIGFSLVTLKQPVTFPNDTRKVTVLIGFVANSADVHVSVALPQIAALLENDENINKILNSNSVEEVIQILEKIDLKKYLNSK